MKRWISSLFIILLLACPWSGQAVTWQDTFEKQIRSWVEELSLQDHRFTPFTQAAIHYEALGPNSRQWIVDFTEKQKYIGYMVIGEGGQGLTLLEYGLGEYPLFDEKAIQPFHSDPLKRTPHYAGLESVWTSTDGIYDAKSGEKYPSDAQPSKKEVTSYITSQDQLLQVIHKDPGSEDPWIKPPGEAIKNKEILMDELTLHEISYIARLFEEKVLAPFSVTGYHHWGKDVFVELEDNGSRFIPFDYAIEIGSFHP